MNVSAKPGLLWSLLLSLALPWYLGAQEAELTAEVGASSIRPPSGVEGDAARFLVAGLRTMRFGPGGSGVSASFLTGWALEDGNGGDFFSGTLEGNYWKPLGGAWSAGAQVRGFGFEVVEPFPYRSLGVEGGPGVRFSTPRLSATLQGLAGTGWSRTEIALDSGNEVVQVTDDLWRYGLSVELLAGSSRMMAGVTAGIHESLGGTFRSGGIRLLSAGSGPVVELRMDLWQTPSGNQTTGGLAFLIPSGGWSLRGFLGRTEPDPLTLAEPGGGAGGLVVGRRFWGRDPLPAPRPPLHRVVSWSEQEATVEIYLPAPKGAEKVEVIGDFSQWEPRAMTRDENRWVARLSIPEGIYHFGFLVDGAWYLPADAPDAVPDEWGRKNATLVIEH